MEQGPVSVTVPNFHQGSNHRILPIRRALHAHYFYIRDEVLGHDHACGDLLSLPDDVYLTATLIEQELIEPNRLSQERNAFLAVDVSPPSRRPQTN